MRTEYELINDNVPTDFDLLEPGSCFLYRGNLYKKVELILATGRRWAINLLFGNGEPVEFDANTCITPIKKVAIHYEI
jgi:hypothetical protein